MSCSAHAVYVHLIDKYLPVEKKTLTLMDCVIVCECVVVAARCVTRVSMKQLEGLEDEIRKNCGGIAPECAHVCCMQSVRCNASCVNA
jgi:hypothetical protein